MSAGDDVLCPRCSATNRPTAARCWVCYSPLAGAGDTAEPPLAETVRTSPGARAPQVTKPKPSTLSVVVKVVIVMVGIAALIPVLLIVTCFGLIAFSSFK